MLSTSNRAVRVSLIALIVAITVIASAATPVQAAGATASFNYYPDVPTVEGAVTFDGESSYSTNSEIAAYDWEYELENGSVATASGPQFSYQWDETGSYKVTLTVYDYEGSSDTQTRTISVSGAQVNNAENNPIVDSIGPYRLIANNDVRANGTELNRDFFSISDTAVQLRTSQLNLPITRIDNRSFTVRQAREYGMLTDTYRENLYEPVYLPTEDSWQPYQDVNVTDTHFVGFAVNNSTTQSSSDDRLVWVKIASRPGWLPVRNALVTASDAPDKDYEITNPNDVEVYDGAPITYTKFNRRVVNKTFISTGPNVSQVIFSDGKPRYPLERASVEGEWQGETDVILDHYAATARITPGALYSDYWVVDQSGINVTVLNDFRLRTPDDYEEQRECSYVVDNETVYGTSTRYETWSRVDYSSTTQLLHDGRLYDSDSSPYLFNLTEPTTGLLTPTSTVEVTFDHEYGVESDCPGESWSETERVTVSNEYRETSHEIQPTSADDLDVTIYLVEKPSGRELHFDIVGDQRPNANPLDTITFVAGGNETPTKRTTLRTPWSVITQSLYNYVDSRQDGGFDSRKTSTGLNSSYHNLHRDYLEGSIYKTERTGTLSISLDERVQSQTFEGLSAGPYVDDSFGIVNLYRTIGGEITYVSGNGTLRNPRGYATDMFGNRQSVDVVTRQYNATQMELSIDQSRISGRLVDADGNGISGRTIALRGAEDESVTTDNGGRFSSTVTGVEVSARFEGDDFRDDRTTYYAESGAFRLSSIGFIKIIGTPIGYLTSMISNLMLFAEWIVLGIFFAYWMKFRE